WRRNNLWIRRIPSLHPSNRLRWRPSAHQRPRKRAPGGALLREPWRRSGRFGFDDHLDRGFNVGVQVHDDLELAGGAEGTLAQHHFRLLDRGAGLRSEEHTSEL